MEEKFKAGDRVKQLSGEGPHGYVQTVRIETTRVSVSDKEKEPPGINVTVLWDNGTTSHFIPEALEKIG